MKIDPWTFKRKSHEYERGYRASIKNIESDIKHTPSVSEPEDFWRGWNDAKKDVNLYCLYGKDEEKAFRKAAKDKIKAKKKNKQ